MRLVVVIVCLVDILREPLAFLLALLVDQFRAGLQMFFELLGRDEEALFVRTLDLILQVAAVSRTKLGIGDSCELALSLLPLNEVLTYRLQRHLFNKIGLLYFDVLSWLLLIFSLHSSIIIKEINIILYNINKRCPARSTGSDHTTWLPSYRDCC